MFIIYQGSPSFVHLALRCVILYLVGKNKTHTEASMDVVLNYARPIYGMNSIITFLMESIGLMK